MLLRQTRAETVALICPSFVALYPSPEFCITASEHELCALLAPLRFGNQRVDASTSMSKALVEQHKGAVPRSIEHLAAPPHLGLYSSHAIAFFAYIRRVPIVDSNVLRLFSRLTGIDYESHSRRGQAPEA
jgi:A/G-specific adenine glycosylase